jgi:hypothetical protein
MRLATDDRNEDGMTAVIVKLNSSATATIPDQPESRG